LKDVGLKKGKEENGDTEEREWKKVEK